MSSTTLCTRAAQGYVFILWLVRAGNKVPKSAAEISRVNQVKREQDNILEEGIRGKTISLKFRVKMMRYKLIGISWVYKGRPWRMTSSSAGSLCC